MINLREWKKSNKSLRQKFLSFKWFENVCASSIEGLIYFTVFLREISAMQVFWYLEICQLFFNIGRLKTWRLYRFLNVKLLEWIQESHETNISFFVLFSKLSHTHLRKFLPAKKIWRSWLPKFYKFFYFRLFSSLKLNCSFDKVTLEARHEEKFLKAQQKPQQLLLKLFIVQQNRKLKTCSLIKNFIHRYFS